MICLTENDILRSFPEGIKKLEIGSGQDPTPGYIHLDIQPDSPDLEIAADVRHMPLPNNFVSEEIRALHIMEHFCHPTFSGSAMRSKYGTTLEVLAECYRVLAPGGRLNIVTPDYEKICLSKANGLVSDDWLQKWTVGGHLDEFDVHHWLWTKKDAEKWFAQVGFKDLKEWNPIRGFKTWFLDWQTTDYNSPAWHQIEWYHWLFFSGKKPD